MSFRESMRVIFTMTVAVSCVIVLVCVLANMANGAEAHPSGLTKYDDWIPSDITSQQWIIFCNHLRGLRHKEIYKYIYSRDGNPHVPLLTCLLVERGP